MAVVIRWNHFLFSAPLDLDFIWHRDSVALINSRCFGATLEPHLIHSGDLAPQ
jgi:hypothetical protein